MNCTENEKFLNGLFKVFTLQVPITDNSADLTNLTQEEVARIKSELKSMGYVLYQVPYVKGFGIVSGEELFIFYTV